MPDTSKSIVQEILLPRLNKHGNRLFVKRDDLIHSDISGNKWRKLKYNILYAANLKKEGILTFGGAFSNHLIATAAACKLEGVKCIGVVRGDELDMNSNSTLKRCTELGMNLEFVSREEYALRGEKSYLEELTYRYPNFFIVPEGGANYYGIIGTQEILKETENNFDIIAIAQGTCTTSAGVLLGTEKSIVWGVPVLKGFDSENEMRELYRRSGIEKETVNDLMLRFEALNEYHFGGYARYSTHLLDFIEEIYLNYNLPLDPVYTSKALYALIFEAEARGLTDKKLLFIHTGGLQGAKQIFEKEKRVIF